MINIGKYTAKRKELYGKDPWRPRNFQDSEELIHRFDDYLDACDEHGNDATQEGMIANLFGSRRMFYYYRDKDYLQEAFEYMDCVLADMTINSNIEGTTKGLILKSKYGYSDKIETVNTNNHNLLISVEEREKYKKELQEKYNIDVIEGG